MDLFRTSLALTLTFAAPLGAQNALGLGTRAHEPAPLPDKPFATWVDADHLPGILQIKFEHGTDVRLRNGRFESGSQEAAPINELMQLAGAVPRRMFDQSEDWLETWRQAGEARSGSALHDLNLFYFIDVPEGSSGASLCDALNGFELVSLAWPAPRGEDPVAPLSPAAPAALGGTPNFQNAQTYLRPAPIGIDARFGNTFSGGRGIGTTIIDCETGWTDDHEDLAGKAAGQFTGWTPANYPWDHGTAVLGEMIGESNGFGVQGICWDADVLMSTHTPDSGPQNIPGSVANAAAAAVEGDFIVVEIQCFGGAPAPFPCEFDPAIFATVQTATANGVHVFAAAGNGGHDLDQAAYGGAFDLQVKDSGAVLVGATDGQQLVTAGFSNYGSRVTSNGWGDDVATTGYGDLQGGPVTQEYTAFFSGTSSATPIVTGAGVILNSVHREAFGSDLDPLALRSLLADTGTPQVSGGAIGTRPDLQSAIRALGVPEVEVTGDLVPGGTLNVTNYGEPGDTYALFWSKSIEFENPLHQPPFGYFYLTGIVLEFNVNGVIGPGGSTTDSYTIPLGLSGLRSYFQSLHGFGTQPGTGSFSNVLLWRIN